ncbi:MAG: serine/threonine protein kinase [Candidatus Obscuribacterales bacterium]|nr:serine/threonine protein kinase [Candidatus Obscuribacterales bacterium]
MVDEHYRLLEHIGDGGCGSVYKATELGLERVVAIKILHANHLIDEESRMRFMREGKILSRLVHPNLPIFYRFGIWQNTWHYIALEFLAGRSMRELMNESKQLPPNQALTLGVQIARAMEVAHANDVIHRDLKPDNVMLVEREEAVDVVKVVDFGLAKISTQSTTGQNLTRTGELVGSVFYMSPEQCRGLPADRRADIYALGCTMYEALAGVPPLDADNPIGLMHKHVCEYPPLLSERLTEAPPLVVAAIDSVLFKAMSKDPADRYDSMEAFADDMEKILAGRTAEIVAGPAILLNAAAPGVDSRRRAVFILAVLGMIFVGAACFFSLRPPPPALPIDSAPAKALAQEQQFLADIGRLHKRLTTSSSSERSGLAQLEFNKLNGLADFYRQQNRLDDAETTLKSELLLTPHLLERETSEVRIYSRLGEVYSQKIRMITDPAERSKCVKTTGEFFSKTRLKIRRAGHPESFCGFLLQYAMFLTIAGDLETLNDVFTEALGAAKQQQSVLGSRGESFSQFASELEAKARPANRHEALMLCDIFLDICDHQINSFDREFNWSGPTFRAKRALLPLGAAERMLMLAFPEKPSDRSLKDAYRQRKERLDKFRQMTTPT